jgi:hypothetical protein
LVGHDGAFPGDVLPDDPLAVRASDIESSPQTYAIKKPPPTAHHPPGHLFHFTKISKEFDVTIGFLGLNFCIVVHAYTSISSNGIDETKHWSIILIYTKFIIFNLPASNI